LQERLDAMTSGGRTDLEPLLAPDQAWPVDPEESDYREADPTLGLSAAEPPDTAEVSQTGTLSPQSQLQGSSLLDDRTQELEMALGEEEESRPPARFDAQPQGKPGVSLFDSSLEELLSELETGRESAPADDSPERHYNLGVAFREMGLLDEAIGEFQKAVKGRQAADNPPCFLEASSLLGNCFMEKQMPEIAAQWYLRALQTLGLDEEIALALTYDLATAYEKSGNLKAAQEKFSEVYSLNIDYRDVAEKIQVLRSKRA
jgi:tetratricopeptide (TPR) repeat protein